METIARMSPVRTSMTTAAPRAFAPMLFFIARFRRPLNSQIDGENNVVAGFGGAPDSFVLAVTEIVHEHGFCARSPAQLRIENAFDSHRTADNPASNN